MIAVENHALGAKRKVARRSIHDAVLNKHFPILLIAVAGCISTNVARRQIHAIGRRNLACGVYGPSRPHIFIDGTRSRSRPVVHPNLVAKIQVLNAGHARVLVAVENEVGVAVDKACPAIVGGGVGGGLRRGRSIGGIVPGSH